MAFTETVKISVSENLPSHFHFFLSSLLSLSRLHHLHYGAPSTAKCVESGGERVAAVLYDFGAEISRDESVSQQRARGGCDADHAHPPQLVEPEARLSGSRSLHRLVLGRSSRRRPSR